MMPMEVFAIIIASLLAAIVIAMRIVTDRGYRLDAEIEQLRDHD